MIKTKKIPFDFVLEKLLPLQPEVKPMFGSFAVYVGEKIMLILRQRESYPEDNGVWIATSQQYHESLRKQFPIRSIIAFGPGETSWQVLPESENQFESKATEICDLILKYDERIGRIPKKKKKKLK
ncbi:MAG: hypothetical protein ACR2GN_08815 [Bacteroidia bacterium]